MNIRPSIQKANIEKQFVAGFEGGRVYPGFRYVFPIIDNNEHLGSVEVSIAYENIEFELAKLIRWSHHILLFKKSITTDLVFDSHKHHFMPSVLSDDFVIENQKISNVTAHSIESELTKKINAILKKRYVNIEAETPRRKKLFYTHWWKIIEDMFANFHAIYDLK